MIAQIVARWIAMNDAVAASFILGWSLRELSIASLWRVLIRKGL
jgi:hypothetical protein